MRQPRRRLDGRAGPPGRGRFRAAGGVRPRHRRPAPRRGRPPGQLRRLEGGDPGPAVRARRRTQLLPGPPRVTPVRAARRDGPPRRDRGDLRADLGFVFRTAPRPTRSSTRSAGRPACPPCPRGSRPPGRPARPRIAADSPSRPRAVGPAERPGGIREGQERPAASRPRRRSAPGSGGAGRSTRPPGSVGARRLGQPDHRQEDRRRPEHPAPGDELGPSRKERPPRRLPVVPSGRPTAGQAC